MFFWINSQAVRSDKGFEVESRGRFVEEYREGGRKIRVSVERGFVDGVKPCVIIEPNAFERWDGDPHDQKISLEKQHEILNNFQDGLEFQGVTVVIEKRFS